MSFSIYPKRNPGKRKVKRWNQNAYSGLPRLSGRGRDGRAVSLSLCAQGRCDRASETLSDETAIRGRPHEVALNGVSTSVVAGRNRLAERVAETLGEMLVRPGVHIEGPPIPSRDNRGVIG